MELWQLDPFQSASQPSETSFNIIPFNAVLDTLVDDYQILPVGLAGLRFYLFGHEISRHSRLKDLFLDSSACLLDIDCEIGCGIVKKRTTRRVNTRRCSIPCCYSVQADSNWSSM
jgi:hypothetical protein